MTFILKTVGFMNKVERLLGYLIEVFLADFSSVAVLTY